MRALSLSLLLLCGSSATAQLVCPPGYAPSSGTCAACAAGSYSATWGGTACAPCPAGSYTASARQTACAACQPGSSSVAGQSGCTACAAGTYSAFAGAPSCTACSAGTSAAAGQSACDVCPPLTYAVGGQPACTTCKGYSVSGAGASACTSTVLFDTAPPSCDAGYYGDSIYTPLAVSLAYCSACPAGQYLGASTAWPPYQITTTYPAVQYTREAPASNIRGQAIYVSSSQAQTMCVDTAGGGWVVRSGYPGLQRPSLSLRTASLWMS